MNDLSLIKVESSDKIRLNSRPYVVLRLNGSSYLSKRAASILDLKPGDLLAFYHTPDLKKWFLANDDGAGAQVTRNGGLFRFCDVKTVKKILSSYGINSRKAFFPTAAQVEEIDGKKTLFIIPSPFNLD